MRTHDDKKRRASNRNAAERPTLAKPRKLSGGLALTLHNGFNRRGRRRPCLLRG